MTKMDTIVNNIMKWININNKVDTGYIFNNILIFPRK